MYACKHSRIAGVVLCSCFDRVLRCLSRRNTIAYLKVQTYEALDTCHVESNIPSAFAPPTPAQLEALATTTKSGWPTPVLSGRRRAAASRPPSSAPHSTSINRSRGRGQMYIAPIPASIFNRFVLPIASTIAMALSNMVIGNPSMAHGRSGDGRPKKMTLPSALVSSGWIVISVSAAKYW